MSNKQGKIRDKNKEIRHNYIMRIETSEKWMSEKLDAQKWQQKYDLASEI